MILSISTPQYQKKILQETPSYAKELIDIPRDNNEVILHYHKSIFQHDG